MVSTFLEQIFYKHLWKVVSADIMTVELPQYNYTRILEYLVSTLQSKLCW